MRSTSRAWTAGYSFSALSKAGQLLAAPWAFRGAISTVASVGDDAAASTASAASRLAARIIARRGATRVAVQLRLEDFSTPRSKRRSARHKAERRSLGRQRARSRRLDALSLARQGCGMARATQVAIRISQIFRRLDQSARLHKATLGDLNALARRRLDALARAVVSRGRRSELDREQNLPDAPFCPRASTRGALLEARTRGFTTAPEARHQAG